MQIRWAVALLAAGCASSERAPIAPPTSPPAASAASAPPVASSAASTPEAPLPAAAEPEIPARKAAQGSTVKTIACGETRCRAGSESCTLETDPYRWVCVPSGAAAEPSYACDDASDCAAPLTCCRRFTPIDDVYVCETPSAECPTLVCSEPDGTKCPRGLRCNGGYCGADSYATCGGGKQCSKEAPYCAWGRAPGCVDEAAAEKLAHELREEGAVVSGIYQCTKPSDCGGQQCCSMIGPGKKDTSCFERCDVASSQMLCTRDAECYDLAEVWCGKDAACRRAVRCLPPRGEPSSPSPPWMKVCRQIED